MTDLTNIEQIKQLINESRNISIFISRNATKEMILAGLAMHRVLEQKDKIVSIYCNSKEVSKLSFLDSTSLIKNKIVPQDFMISLGYGKDEIEKVGYDTKDGQFTLVITPKKGKIDSSQITFGTTSLQMDLIIVLGAQSLSDIGESYSENPDEFVDKNIINIDNHENNSLFGTINQVSTEKNLLIQILFSLFKELDIRWEDSIANLLLMGIYMGSDSFQSKTVSVETFSTVSSLLNKGANLTYVVDLLYPQKDSERGNKKEAKEGSKVEIPSPNVSVNQESQPTPFVKKQEDIDGSQNHSDST